MIEDIQGTDIEEFDFQGNLAKFPKEKVFDQYRQNDCIKEIDRLMLYSRLPKLGAAGGKNLHHTENVLNAPSTLQKTLTMATNTDFWNSEAENGGIIDGEDKRLANRELRSDHSSRRSDSKTSATQKSQSCKTSTQVMSGHSMTRVNSSVSFILNKSRVARRDTTTQTRDRGMEYSESSQGYRTVVKKVGAVPQ